MRRRLVFLGFAAGLVLPAIAPAAEGQEALFALIIGVNKSVDEDLQPLRYADDDAARYFELFRSLGARTYLLTRPDDNTRRLHPQAAAEARQPGQESLQEAVRLLAADIDRARKSQVRTTFYLAYAGHGNVKNNQGYISLEDARLTGRQILKDVVAAVRADQAHLVIDACHSYHLAYARGPGGKRREIHGFSHVEELARNDRVGLLLSTSSARDSHEWEAFQAGVFSHEVRSGLHGAADADGDGRVSYREIAAFVERANAAIPNERFRPRIYARPPRGSDTLLDIGHALRRRLEIDGPEHAHYFLEDIRGVRLSDFHNGPGQQVRLLRPAAAGLMYLRRVSDQQEFTIPPAPEVVRLAALTANEPRTIVRGAAHHAFQLLFSLPFDTRVVEQYEPPDLVELEAEAPPSPVRWRSYAGWGALGLAGAAAASGVIVTLSARDIRESADPDASCKDLVALNERIHARNMAAVALYSVAGAAAVTGLLVLLWPDEQPRATVDVSPEGAFFTLGATF